MVKNTTGGSKTKGQARKFVSARPSNALRLSNDESEVYAQVIKVLGGAMCHVLCMDEKTRLCHIRGKFRGRGKRDNFIGINSWVLIGLREWEAERDGVKDKKLENCDLLEVYSEHDKDRLKNTITTLNWSIFVANDRASSSSKIDTDEATFEFMDERTEEYHKLVSASITKSTTIVEEETVAEEEINVDDI
jgi:translation initiation factor 1A